MIFVTLNETSLRKNHIKLIDTSRESLSISFKNLFNILFFSHCLNSNSIQHNLYSFGMISSKHSLRAEGIKILK